MTDETTYGAAHDRTKIAVLREAVDRADNLAVTQARLIVVQEEMIETLKETVRLLESHNAELRLAVGRFTP
jgi:hypothetical protein